MSTYNRLDLQTLRSQPDIMPKNLPAHYSLLREPIAHSSTTKRTDECSVAFRRHKQINENDSTVTM